MLNIFTFLVNLMHILTI